MFAVLLVLLVGLSTGTLLHCPSADDGFFQPEQSLGTWHVSHGLINCGFAPLAWPFFRLHSLGPRPSRRQLIITFLLLMSGIESNPGPSTQNVSSNNNSNNNNKSSPRTLVFGSLNVRSAVKKGALIRDLIESHNIDILAACETWFNPDDPNAIKLDMAPPGYITKNLNTAIPGRAGRCGGLALIYRDTLTIRHHPIMDSIETTSFHYQASRLTIDNKTFCIINIYRWPDSNINVFYDELSSLLADVTVAVDCDRLVVCGDLNCPGSTESTVADQLTEVLNTFGLTQLVTKPTRFGSTSMNLLDVMITGHSSPLLSNIEVCPTHELSDHCLVKCELNQTLNRRLLVTFQYRKLKQLDIGLFRAELTKSELFTAPEQTVDAFAQQINSTVNIITAAVQYEGSI